MKSYIDLFIRSAIAYIFFRPSLGASLVKYGVSLLALLLAGFSGTVIFPTLSGDILLAFDASTDTAGLLFKTALGVSLLLIAAGLMLILRDIRRDNRKKVIAIELLGLRDITAKPLANVIAVAHRGHRESLMIDIRQGADGRLLTPEAALSRLVTLPHSLSAMMAGRDRDDIHCVAAALAPVPFAFLFGVLLDDESEVELMDWDRSALTWRGLMEDDDGARFAISGLDAVGAASEVVVAIGFSYPTDKAAIAQCFPGLPVLDLTLSGYASDAHWSAQKQAALADQFFELARNLCATSVCTVHLVMAAPASVAIRFGRIYDIRNLPELTVYQYERKQDPPYPWGVKMPIAGEAAAIVRRLSHADTKT
jgi:hypothetical protein